MHIVNQHSVVNHQFTQQRQRDVAAASISAQPEAKLRSSGSDMTESGEVSLTPKQRLQKLLIEHLTGRPLAAKDVGLATESVLSPATSRLTATGQGQSTRLIIKEQLYEFEKLSYHTQLRMAEKDKPDVQLVFSFEYQREISISREFSLSVTQFKDPLIVNLGQQNQLFAPGKTPFDLDANGQQQSLPKLNSDVWYLAYDRNQNGKVDDGSELFGALSGNGFAELSRFDSNHNGLIETQDEEFSQLHLWKSHHALTPLSQRGIKAISTQAHHTPFTFTDNQAEPIAALRQTAVYIDDKNRLGAVHQIDFVV